jgi:hypothetical protein
MRPDLQRLRARELEVRGTHRCDGATLHNERITQIDPYLRDSAHTKVALVRTPSRNEKRRTAWSCKIIRAVAFGGRRPILGERGTARLELKIEGDVRPGARAPTQGVARGFEIHPEWRQLGPEPAEVARAARQSRLTGKTRQGVGRGAPQD